MEFAFYLSGLVAIISTALVISSTNAAHGLLYLIVSLLSVASIFFAVGAPFAGALEVVVYAGAIMVLFMFVIMMNLVGETENKEVEWTHPDLWIGPAILSAILLAQMMYALWFSDIYASAGMENIYSKQVGIALYGPYLLCVELASILLLAALVAAYHLGRFDEKE